MTAGFWARLNSSFVKYLAFYVRDVIDVGVEILPMKTLQSEMSSGPAYYEEYSTTSSAKAGAFPLCPWCWSGSPVEAAVSPHVGRRKVTVEAAVRSWARFAATIASTPAAGGRCARRGRKTISNTSGRYHRM